MSCTRLMLGMALVLAAARAYSAGLVEASAPQGTTLSIYDAGYALVTENRRVALARGDNEVVFRPVPAMLDPASVSLVPLGAPVDVRLLDTRIEHDGANVERLFARYVGQAITVQDGAGTRAGELLSAPDRGGSFLLLDGGAGTTRAVGLAGVREVVFPAAASRASLEPALRCRVASAQDGLQTLRLGYLAHKLEWSAHHEVTVVPDGTRARFDTRVRVANYSGAAFTDALVKLISTARGQAEVATGEVADLRFRYGGAEPVAAPQVAGLAPAQSYELGRSLSLRAGEVAFTSLIAAEQLAVTRFYVYDGVKFDRFPRNRRTDWNLGTVCQNTVDTHLEFANAKGSGLGLDLPPGRLRVLQARADGTVDFLGEDVLQATGAGAVGQVRVGPARGLLGERERTGYTEF